jgi:hypothetical protein
MARKCLSPPDRTLLQGAPTFPPFESNVNLVQTRCYCRPCKLLFSFPRLVYTVGKYRVCLLWMSIARGGFGNWNNSSFTKERMEENIIKILNIWSKSNKINRYNFSEINSLLTLWSSVVTTYETCISFQKLCILPIKCICVSLAIFRTPTLFLKKLSNSDVLSRQGFCSQSARNRVYVNFSYEVANFKIATI